jgi:transposase-like protein
MTTQNELFAAFADEDTARRMMESIRWPNGPVCPHCRDTGPFYEIKGKTARKGVRKCQKCRKQFSVMVGTVFERSHIPMNKWLYAIFAMNSSKKGVSANQLHRELGITYKSAWFMCHRIREAMTENPSGGKLGGFGEIVEVDETYVGGKLDRNTRARAKNEPKAIVVGLIERDGKARTFHMPSATQGFLQSLIKLNVEDVTHIMTDSHKSYSRLKHHFAGHEAVDHSKEYVRGIVHTNFAESYFSLFKRGVMGSFHHISKEHLPRYLREFEFRWNRRKLANIEIFFDAVRGAEGKRLQYRTT